MHLKRFDFYGVMVLIACDDDEILDRILEDFRYFSLEDTPDSDRRTDDIVIHAHRREPDFNSLPPLRATVHTPRNICYTSRDITYIDYFGKALSIYNRNLRTLDIYSNHPHLLHEIAFLSVLSRVNEELERRGMHRVHALAIERNGSCALFLLPSGGGKTTIGMGILKQDVPYRLVSEDSPLITRSGRVLPFPLRFGIVAGNEPEFAPEHVTYIERMEFAPKYLISLKAFEGRIAEGVFLPDMVFIGQRTLAATCTIRKTGRISGFKALIRHMIIGVGLYQGVEFMLQTSLLDLFKYAGLFLSRLMSGVAMLYRAKVFVVELGRDPRANLKEILAFLEAEGLGVRK